MNLMFCRSDHSEGRLYFYYDEAWSIGVHCFMGSRHFVLRYWLVHTIHSQCVLKAFVCFEFLIAIPTFLSYQHLNVVIL